MKAIFEQPEIRLEKFMMEDIVTVSGGGDVGGGENDLPFLPVSVPAVNG